MSLRAKTKLLLPCAFASVVSAWSPPGVAQTLPSLDTRTWRPSTDAEATLVLEPTSTPGPWQANFGAWMSYAQSPVVLRDGAGQAVQRPLFHSLGCDLVAGLGLGDRAALGIDVPLMLWQDGSSGLSPAVVTGGKVPMSGLGDISLNAKVSILESKRVGLGAGFGLAAIGSVSLPTGDPASFQGEGSATVSARLLAEYGLGIAAFRASLGYTARTDYRTWPDASLGGVPFGDSVPWSVGLVVRPNPLVPALDSGDRQLWELAVHGALPAGPVAPFGLGRPGASSLSPALLSIGDRIALGHNRDAFVLLGAEVGLDQAVGVPAVRGILALGWAPRAHDRDNDGVPDDRDECPDLAEDRDGIQDEDGCPEDDADGDGVLDTEDACPLVPGVESKDPRANGCPPAGVSASSAPGPNDAEKK